MACAGPISSDARRTAGPDRPSAASDQLLLQLVCEASQFRQELIAQGKNNLQAPWLGTTAFMTIAMSA